MSRKLYLIVVILLLSASTAWSICEVDTGRVCLQGERSRWETNPLKLFVRSLLYLYQNFIADQDIQKCQFSPSCSRFAIKAFSLTDPLQALLMTADRLQRCNPTAHLYYKRASDGLHLADPPELHILFGRKRTRAVSRYGEGRE